MSLKVDNGYISKLNDLLPRYQMPGGHTDI